MLNLLSTKTPLSANKSKMKIHININKSFNLLPTVNVILTGCATSGFDRSWSSPNALIKLFGLLVNVHIKCQYLKLAIHMT